jgi:NAD-dependent protein deacetylase/lipoamidase
MPDRKSRRDGTTFGNIVVLTGAGISRESGLDTFRDPDGIWAKVNVEDVATPMAFARNPGLVHEFYNSRRRQLLSGSVHPNRAHLALAELQRFWNGKVLLVTQNIDDLHERAGSVGVLHIHGELLKARCSSCQRLTECIEDLSAETKCSGCGRSATMRPHVVWFGEMPMHMDFVQRALEQADLFISIGTSGTVYPAAAFVETARSCGAHTVELNLESSANASLFDEALYGPATKVVTEYVKQLLSPVTPVF